MSWTYVNSINVAGGGSDTTLAIELTGIHVGDVIVVAVGAVGTNITGVSDGTSSFTLGTLNSGGGEFLRMGYLLSSTVSGSVTYTATFSPAASARNMHVWAYTPSSEATFDVQRADFVQITNAVDTGNVTTTGTSELVVVGGWAETPSTWTSLQINGVAADRSLNLGVEMVSWVRENVSATFTGSGTATAGATSRTFANIMTFNTTSGRTFVLTRL